MTLTWRQACTAFIEPLVCALADELAEPDEISRILRAKFPWPPRALLPWKMYQEVLADTMRGMGIATARMKVKAAQDKRAQEVRWEDERATNPIFGGVAP